MSNQSYNMGAFSAPQEALSLESHGCRASLESDVYENVYTFNVRVLTKPLPFSPDGTHTTGFKFKGRIIEPPFGSNRPPSPHSLLPDPCRMDVVGSDNEKRNQIAKTIAMHTEFISGASTSGGAIPNVGDEVVVTLQPGNYSYNVQQAQFTSLFIRVGYSDAGLNLICAVPGGLGSLFEEGSAVFGPVASSTGAHSQRAASSAPAFYQKLLISPHFADFCPEALAGLTANAQHESAFNAAASGDPVQSFTGTYAPSVAIPVSTRGGGQPNYYNSSSPTGTYCSFGYWQLNICSTSAGGHEFLEWAATKYDDEGLRPGSTANKSRQFAALTSDDKQFAFLAQKIKAMTNLPDPTNCGAHDAEWWGQQIAVQFERCAWCKEVGTSEVRDGRVADYETIARGAAAKDLMNQIQVAEATGINITRTETTTTQ